MTKTLLRFTVWSAKWIALVCGYLYNLYWLIENTARGVDAGEVWFIFGTNLAIIHLTALGLGAIYKRLPKGTGVPRITTALLRLFIWTIKWTAYVAGWPLILFSVVAGFWSWGLGFVVAIIIYCIMEEITDFCDDARTALKAGGIKTPLELAEFELNHYVPMHNNRVEAIPSDDTMQVPGDLGYPTEYVVRDRWLARFYCPHCGTWKWYPEFDNSYLTRPIPKCEWCGTDPMIPVKIQDRGKPVILPEQIHEYRNATTGEGKTKSNRLPPAAGHL